MIKKTYDWSVSHKFSALSFCNRGVILVESLSAKISLGFLFSFLQIFGKISRFFFLPNRRRKKILGWIEFWDKKNAKKVSVFFKKFPPQSIFPWGVIKLRYLKNFRWDKIINQTSKKNQVKKKRVIDANSFSPKENGSDKKRRILKQ